MRTRAVILAAATLVTLLVIGGCEAYGPTATELDHGNSVRHMVQSQTLNPAPLDAAPVEATDTSRIRNALEVYRSDVTPARDSSNGTKQQQ